MIAILTTIWPFYLFCLDDENGLNTVKEEDLSSAEDGTLLKVNPLGISF